MVEPRMSVTALDRSSDLLSPRRAAGGTCEAIAQDQINALHQSLLTTAGIPAHATRKAREKD
jgi:hypothetical protein